MRTPLKTLVPSGCVRYLFLTNEGDEDTEAHTLGILRELREMAKEISHGHMDYANRFHEVLQSLANPNLPEVAKELQYGVTAYALGTRQRICVIAVCGNPTVARAAYECACKISERTVGADLGRLCDG